MAAPSKRWRVLARAGEIEYDRILFFSDAVFAIAITLLIVDLRVPDVAQLQSGRQLRHAIPQIGGFAYSFAAIGLFWLAHHGLFRHIKGLDRPLVLLNLLFLGTIAFVPYPTALLSAAGDQVPATVFYAASLAAVGLAEAAVWLYAIRIRELALPGCRRPCAAGCCCGSCGLGGVPAVDPSGACPAEPGEVAVAADLRGWVCATPVRAGR
jgi:hypothetical protein